MRRDLPSGTVTFLLSDVEGSTRLLHELGPEAYGGALAEHRRIVREAFRAHQGVEVDTQGDAFFVAFPTAAGAVAAAAAARDALAAGPMRARIGIHTGTPHLAEEGYIGADVHRAARIAAAGHGGQVLISAATVALLGSEGLRDLGEHRLKDFDEPIAIHQLGNERFPPLRTISNTNLPRPASSFVGRDADVAEVASMLRDGVRLLTLTGPGGSGKTRLAIEAASMLVPEFKAGVFWAGLAPLRDPALVTDAIGQTLGAKVGLAEHIGARELLLLLDNLEQVVESAPALAALVEACPNLRLLVTSRELLRVRGEVEYPVLPLANRDAVELFGARARIRPDVTVHRLCQALDNLPLAIELAAARVSVLTPSQILERLSERLDLLKGGRDADPRQQTIRATIEWSYDLLTPSERRLFAGLAVFAGGWTLEAAGKVTAADLDTLQSLIDKSLVRRTEHRFWMLETIREFASDRLEASVEADDLHHRHAEQYLEVAESANLSVEALGRGPQRHDLVLPEQANLRAAIDWATINDVELGLRLAIALENFWVTHDPAEGIRRFEALLDRASDVAPSLMARAWRDYGACADRARDLERALTANARSGELFREAGDENGVATTVFRRGVIATMAGDMELGRRLWEESLETWMRLGNNIGVLQALGNLGWFEFEHGDPERGWDLTERSPEMAREAGWTWWEAGRMAQLAEHAIAIGRTDEGERRAREFLALADQIKDRENTVFGLVLLAWAAADRGDSDRATTLWAAVEAEEAEGPLPLWAQIRDRYAARIPPATGAVPQMTLGGAVAYALNDGDHDQGPA